MRTSKAPNVELIIKTVKEMGGQVLPISKDRFTYEIRLAGKSLIFASKFAIKNDLISSPRLAQYKDLTYEVLKRKGFSMPKTIPINTSDSLPKIMKSISGLKYPIVIKDAQGSESNGVFSNVETKKDAIQIISEVKNVYGHLVIQEKAVGKEFRILVLNDQVIAALEFIPPFIVGDGRKTTENLITRLQKTTPRKTPRDKYLIKLLKEQGEKLMSVPKSGKKIYLRKNSCLAEGGVSVDVTEKISSRFAKIVAASIKPLGLRLGGVDVFCKDITKGEKDYQLIEINGRPDLYIHNYPTLGRGRDVAKVILEYIIEKVL